MRFTRWWQGRLFEGGWAGLAWPRAYGGRELGILEQMIWGEEYARAWAPDLISLGVGISLTGPVLIAKGKDWQRRGLPAQDPDRRAHLVSGLLGAGRRLGPRGAAHARRRRSGRDRRHRPEDLDQLRAVRRLVHPDRAHRSERQAQARRHHVPARRHADARHRDPSAQGDDGRGLVQPGVLRPRARSHRERGGRDRRRLGRRSSTRSRTSAPRPRRTRGSRPSWRCCAISRGACRAGAASRPTIR